MGRKRSRGGGQSSFQRNGADSGRGGRNNGWLDFASSPHGVGESRLAFRCRVEDGCYRGYTEGSYLIFKVFRPDPIYRHVSDVDGRDVHMQHCAVRYHTAPPWHCCQCPQSTGNWANNPAIAFRLE